MNVVRTALLLLLPRFSPTTFAFLLKTTARYSLDEVFLFKSKACLITLPRKCKFCLTQKHEIKCREKCAPQNREIIVSQKFHVIR